MDKYTLLEMVQKLKTLAVIDFSGLSDDERTENQQYENGYIDALDKVYEQFKNNL